MPSGGETWARNWAALLATKTPEGAYSFLKVFTKGHPGSSDEPKTGKAGKGPGPAQVKHKKRKRGGAGAEAEPGVDDDEDDQDAADEDEAAGKLSIEDFKSFDLDYLLYAGTKPIEASADYKQLFDAGGRVSALGLKMMESRIEIFLLDWVWGLGCE